MMLKQLAKWLARPGRPAITGERYANDLAPRIITCAEELASVLVVFSGRRDSALGCSFLFNSAFEMEQAGFDEYTNDFIELHAPDLNSCVTDPLFGPVFRSSLGLLSLLATQATLRGCRDRKKGKCSSEVLMKVIASRVSGKHGFELDATRTLELIKAFGLAFFDVNLKGKPLLNLVERGRNDCLGEILTQVRVSPDGRTSYGFVVGPEPFTIVPKFVQIASEVREWVKKIASQL